MFCKLYIWYMGYSLVYLRVPRNTEIRSYPKAELSLGPSKLPESQISEGI